MILGDPRQRATGKLANFSIPPSGKPFPSPPHGTFLYGIRKILNELLCRASNFSYWHDPLSNMSAKSGGPASKTERQQIAETVRDTIKCLPVVSAVLGELGEAWIAGLNSGWIQPGASFFTAARRAAMQRSRPRHPDYKPIAFPKPKKPNTRPLIRSLLAAL